MIYVQERIRPTPEGFEEFVGVAAAEQVPLYHDLGLHLVAYWETVHSQGYWPEVIALWEADDYADFARAGERGYAATPLGRRYRDWQDHLGRLARESRGVLLTPSSQTPTLAELRARGRSGALCLHESITTLPLKSREYSEQVVKLWAPVGERYGRRLFGAYHEVWHNTQATNIWALDSWDVLGGYADFPADPDYQTWTEVALALRTSWEDRLLVALPFSPV
jgi:hypothetical protein